MRQAGGRDGAATIVAARLLALALRICAAAGCNRGNPRPVERLASAAIDRHWRAVLCCPAVDGLLERPQGAGSGDCLCVSPLHTAGEKRVGNRREASKGALLLVRRAHLGFG